MALSDVTLLVATANTSTTNNVASGSVSPSSDAFLIVAVATVEVTTGVNTHDSMSTTLSNVGTWTKQQFTQYDDATYESGISIWTAKITGAPGTGTVTCTFSNNIRRKVIAVHEVTGEHATPPVVQGNVNSGAADTLTVTLGSSPGAASLVFAAVNSRNEADGITPGTGFSELTDTTSGGVTFQAKLETEFDRT